jgi:hypothetical protein
MTGFAAPYALTVLDIPGADRPSAALVLNLGLPVQMPPTQELFGLLGRIGWVPLPAPMLMGARPDPPPIATLHICESGLRLRTHTELNDGVLHVDAGRPPDPPEGWWQAVDRGGHQCLVLLVDVINLRRMRTPVRRLAAATRRGTVLMGSATVHTDH